MAMGWPRDLHEPHSRTIHQGCDVSSSIFNPHFISSLLTHLFSPFRCIALHKNFEELYEQAQDFNEQRRNGEVIDLPELLAMIGPEQPPTAAMDTGSKLGNTRMVFEEKNIGPTIMDDIFAMMERKGVCKSSNDRVPLTNSELENLKTAYALKVLSLYVYRPLRLHTVMRGVMFGAMEKAVEKAWVHKKWRGKIELRPLGPKNLHSPQMTLVHRPKV